MRKLALLLVTLMLTGCIPYAVGETARTVPNDEFEAKLLVYSVPNGIEDMSDDDTADPQFGYVSADFEGRWGLSDRSDIGIRVPSGSGAIVNYKRLLNGPNDPNRPAYAILVGTGIVNFENHAYFEAGLLASGRVSERTPYGGVRIMHVIPIASSAVDDDPTVGVFGGLQIRVNQYFSISPELGVYHDKPALGLRDNDIIFVPSVTFRWH